MKIFPILRAPLVIFLSLLATLVASPSLADDTVNPDKIPGERVLIEATKSVQVLKNAKEALFRDLLVRFSVTPSDSLPPSVIVAGKVISNNAGTEQELVAIFFGSPLHQPCLAGLTNADGEFRFRVWLKGDRRDLRLQTPTLDDGVLYVGLRLGGFEDESILLRRTSAYMYSFRELLVASRRAAQPAVSK